MSDLVFARNCSIENASRRSRVGVGMNRSAGRAKSVKRFERTNGRILRYIKTTFKLPFFGLELWFG